MWIIPSRDPCTPVAVRPSGSWPSVSYCSWLGHGLPGSRGNCIKSFNRICAMCAEPLRQAQRCINSPSTSTQPWCYTASRNYVTNTTAALRLHSPCTLPSLFLTLIHVCAIINSFEGYFFISVCKFWFVICFLPPPSSVNGQPSWTVFF